MTAITISWSLETCPNKSLKELEPAVPSQSTSDPHFIFCHGRSTPVRETVTPLLPRPLASLSLCQKTQTLRTFLPFSHFSTAAEILSKAHIIIQNQTKNGSALLVKTGRNVRNSSTLIQATHSHPFTTAQSPARFRTFPHFLHPGASLDHSNSLPSNHSTPRTFPRAALDIVHSFHRPVAGAISRDFFIARS